MTRLTLHWTLRELAGESGTSPIVDTALQADDTVQALNTIRSESWRPYEDRHLAADLLTDHLWPADTGAQKPTWHTNYTRNKYELQAKHHLGTYNIPTDAQGNSLAGYHFGGFWLPEIPRAEPLSCPDCHHEYEFWDFQPVDAGQTHEPAQRCPVCQWVPPDADPQNRAMTDGVA